MFGRGIMVSSSVSPVLPDLRRYIDSRQERGLVHVLHELRGRNHV